jgi:PAS domain S-box-containing protein
MNNEVDQFLATNQNPVLRVDKNGIILYSNEAGESLLNVWGAGVGKKLPSSIGDLVQRVISRNSPEKMEIKVGERLYSTVFHPLYEEKCVCISGFDISDQNELKENIQENEAKEKAGVGLAEVIDTRLIQSLMDDFYKLAHITMALVDLKGNVLVGVGWQDICTQFHRICPGTCKNCMESDTELSSGVSHGEFKQYRCKNGMWDIATPIIVGGQHVGNAFLGQFFFDDESLDYELFRAQAKKYGFNEEEYIIALEKVPRLNREVVELGMTFIMNLANLLSQLSYNNNRLAQSLSERDALVDALRESEKRERARSEELVVVLDAVPAAVMIAHDPQALEMTGNRLSYEWIRLPEGTNISKALPERKRAETHKLFKDGVEIPLADMPLRMSASGKEVHDYEFDVVYPDGKIRNVLGNARPLLDEQGNSRGAVAALMDITERKQTEEALNKAYEQLQIQSEELQASNEELLAQSEELLAQTEKIQDAYHALSKSEERYRMLFTNMTEAFFLAEIIYNEEGKPFDLRYLEINPAFELHTGIKRENVLGKSFLDVFTNTDFKYTDSFVEVALSGKSTNFEMFSPATGNHFEVHAFSPEKGKLAAIFNNITGRKQMEKALHKSEEKYRGIVETANECIIITDKEATVTYTNKRLEDMFGYSLEEVIGRPIWGFISAESKAIFKLLPENG